MNYMNVRTTAKLWNISERRITTLCKYGRVEGAIKEGHAWMIPENTRKPEDGRARKSMAKAPAAPRLPLPIGISDFREAARSYYYVDKTLLIRDLLDSRPKASLFTRPGRFGKTLNMEMLRVFFEASPENTAVYFEDKAIWECGEKYTSQQGKYPVIFISFKDVQFLTWGETKEGIRQVVQNEYNRHYELASSQQLTPYEKDYFQKVLKNSLDDGQWPSVLGMLSQLLHKHYGTAPILLVDEYDAPIQQGHLQDFQEQAVTFMRGLFSSVLKDNPHLSFACLTGILQAPAESMFHGMNHLKTHSILDGQYSGYFGFTKSEVEELTTYYGKPDKYDEICRWYGGYLFGDTEVFNPCSVITYLDAGCRPKAYWQPARGNGLVLELARGGTPETLGHLLQLIQGDRIPSYVDISIGYPGKESHPSAVFSFLLATGYLKTIDGADCGDGNSICSIAIPNRETACMFEKEVLSGLSGKIPQACVIAIRQAIARKDIQDFQNQLQKLLVQMINEFSRVQESAYQILMLGLCTIMGGLYQITSQEPEAGQYNIQMQPCDKAFPSTLIELNILRKKGKGSVTGRLAFNEQR